ncbi:MAG: glycerol-3-phosphate 1-O-acyltransferase PlsY [Planctomycetes bacterium]|nr:glycerol-3-phosphate 1-O-acyltransferase PlsY [Planctomycetota bacterium]
MSSLTAAVLLLIASYLVGAIPFGYLIGRMRGVNLFTAGSGNIGATNAARVLGTPIGVLVFTLDFLKGAVPVAAILPLARQLSPDADTVFGQPDTLRVSAAALAFLGHLFPIYLGFSGGKGVATGAGTIFVLVPGPAALAVLCWFVVLLASRIVSLASLAAVAVLVAARLIGTSAAFSEQALPITLFVIIGTAFVFAKHHSNLRRLLMGTESQSLPASTRRQTILRGVHLLALGLWFGGAAFFNFAAAPAIFDSFKQVVNAGPSDRTAGMTIIPADAPDEQKTALASALFGAAVGPVFPRYFGMQAVCGVIALITAMSWYKAPCACAIHRRRVHVIGLALLTVVIAFPLSNYVSELRVLRFSTDKATADAATAAFAPWHFASLLLSLVTVCLAGFALSLAGRLPEEATNTPKIPA